MLWNETYVVIEEKSSGRLGKELKMSLSDVRCLLEAADSCIESGDGPTPQGEPEQSSKSSKHHSKSTLDKPSEQVKPTVALPANIPEEVSYLIQALKTEHEDSERDAKLKKDKGEVDDDSDEDEKVVIGGKSFPFGFRQHLMK